MFKHIEGNVYSIPIPLPNNPLRELNSYVIKDPERSLVIDTGFNLPECRAALTAGLEELEIDMDRADVFLTHLHSDHSGLAGAIAGRDSRIYISRTDGELLRRSFTDGFDRVNEYRADGFSEAELAKIDENPARRYLQDTLPVFTFVSGGDRIEYGGRKLRVISTPGHTPGHLCLYDKQNRIMFLGDHVLFDITPNITCWPGFDDPLGHYVHSLMDISIYDVRLPLPGHRGVGCTMAERIGTIIEHHGTRIREMVAVLDEKPGLTPYELAGLMRWRVHGKTNSWADFPLTQKWFAVGETAAHLEYLLCRDRVHREFDGRVWRYFND